MTPQLTLNFDLVPMAQTALDPAHCQSERSTEWSFCENYCKGPVASYRLTLWPGQDREWTGPETHRMCATCAAKTIERGNRLAEAGLSVPALQPGDALLPALGLEGERGGVGQPPG